MADAAVAPEPPADAAAAVVDDELALADGLRKTAAWIAGAFGAIPVFATIGALTQNAGDNGFDRDRLAQGLVFAVIGVLFGVAGSGYVRAPLGTRLDDITDEDVRRVPGSPYRTKAELVASVDTARQAIADLEEPAQIAAVDAKRKRAVAERLAENLKQMRTQVPNATIASLTDAAALHAGAALDAEAAERIAGFSKADVERWEIQLARRKTRLDQAFLLHGATIAKDRMVVAASAWVIAACSIAASLYFLATAPIKKDAEAAPAVAPELVQISLNATGKTQLQCTVETLQGLRIGGTDKLPVLITFPQADCPSRAVTFVAGEPTPWGTVEKVKAIETQG